VNILSKNKDAFVDIMMVEELGLGTPETTTDAMKNGSFNTSFKSSLFF
jgi:hypothetical protein